MSRLTQLFVNTYRKALMFGACSLFALPSCAHIVTDDTANKSPVITEKQAKALSMLEENKSDNEKVKHLRLNITKLSDSDGQEYLGAVVNRADLQPYLAQLKAILTDDFDDFRANQAARDHQSFHVTLINPIEYQLVNKDLVQELLSSTKSVGFSSQLEVTLQGLGKVEKAEKSTYFVVAQSNSGQLIRQRFLLKAKDFHVTLGFNPSDIYGVRKNESTLIEE